MRQRRSMDVMDGWMGEGKRERVEGGARRGDGFGVGWVWGQRKGEKSRPGQVARRRNNEEESQAKHSQAKPKPGQGKPKTSQRQAKGRGGARTGP
eukprot:13149-Rhodomonas_salina.1